MSTAGLAFAGPVCLAGCCAKVRAPGAEVKMPSASTIAGKVKIRRCILPLLSSELCCELDQISHDSYLSSQILALVAVSHFPADKHRSAYTSSQASCGRYASQLSA